MKIFSRQTIFFCFVVCVNNFFRLHLSADNFFLYTCVQAVVSVGDDEDEDINNKFFMVFVFSFLFTPRLTGYSMRPV